MKEFRIKHYKSSNPNRVSFYFVQERKRLFFIKYWSLVSGHQELKSAESKYQWLQDTYNK